MLSDLLVSKMRQVSEPTRAKQGWFSPSRKGGAKLHEDDPPLFGPGRPRTLSEDSMSTMEAEAGSRIDFQQARADSMMELVRSLEGVSKISKVSESVASLEQIVSQKMLGTSVHAAKTLVSSVGATALETLDSGKRKATEVSENVKEVCADRRTQVSAASAVGGAVALGTGGGATGFFSGAAVGAACGVVPALFTFGLSIPTGAAFGGGLGMAAGLTICGTAGFLGGGAAGWKAYGHRHRGSSQETAEMEGSAHDNSLDTTVS